VALGRVWVLPAGAAILSPYENRPLTAAGT
jgi:hypothetical protein